MADLHSPTHLKSLVLQEMSLTESDATPDWVHLEMLDLSANDLERVPDLSGITSLTEYSTTHQYTRLQLDRPLDFLQHLPALIQRKLNRGSVGSGAWSPQSLVYLADAIQTAQFLKQPLDITF